VLGTAQRGMLMLTVNGTDQHSLLIGSLADAVLLLMTAARP
jgi:hypothetical protein